MKVIDKQISTPVKEMKDGQIATIVSWERSGVYVGQVVQRFGNHLVTLGEPIQCAWEDLFLHKDASFNLCFVEILPKGTKLEI